jgi:prephenate dehydrogenase
MLRLARSDASLWGAIAQANAGALADAVRALAAVLEATADGLEAGDLDALLAAFAQAHQAVEALDAAPETYAFPKR